MIHLARDGAQLGQFTLDQVNAMLASGQLKASDLSWKEGLPGWIPVAELEGVQASGTSGHAAVSFSGGAPAGSVYAPPAASLSPASGAGSHVSAGTVLALQQTRPWVLFISILGLIVTGLMLLGGLFALLAGSFAGSVSTPTSSTGPGAGIPSAMLMGMAIGYLLMSFLCLYPLIKLFKYAGAISALTRSGRVADLEAALRHQKSFWKYMGIFLAVMIVVYIGIIIVVGAGAFTMASGASATP